MTTDLTTATPVEIDTFLATNYAEQNKYWLLARSEVKHMESLEHRITKAPEQAMAGIRTQWEDANQRLIEYRIKREDAINASVPYVLEYNRRPWNRYYLVQNVNGHVHRGMNCVTCFNDTEYGWLVDLADCDEDAMIEEWGEMACTVCFPTAPTNPNYHRPSRRDREARAVREAEKSEREAKKAEKSITDVDGSPLRVDGDILRTKVAARNELSRLFQNVVYYGDHPSDFEGQARKLVPALEAAGVEWHQVAERAIKKAVKETEVPAHNPYRLTPEQIKEFDQKIVTNTARAKALLAEVSGR
jgi:hypothetical protein